MSDIAGRLQEIGERICEHCGVAMGHHDYEYLGRECYPKQIERLRADNMERLRVLRGLQRLREERLWFERKVVGLEAKIERLQAENARLQGIIQFMEATHNAVQRGTA